MALTSNKKLSGFSIAAEVPELALAEPSANLVESIPLTSTDYDDYTAFFTYSATAEDLGTAGNLDGQPGLIYNGEGGAVSVSLRNVDTLEHAITAPEATDKAALTIFVNSTAMGYGDEGFSAHASEIAVENNLDTYVSLVEGDVLRVGFTFTGEADGDLDVAPGELVIY